MNSTTKRTQKDYSLAFKLAVVAQVEKGELTYKQAQDRYGIQGKSTVLVWLRKWGKLDWSAVYRLFILGAFLCQNLHYSRQSSELKSWNNNLQIQNNVQSSLRLWLKCLNAIMESAW